MEKSRPQLSLAELYQLRWFLGGVLGLLSAWTLFYMEVDALLALTLLTLTVPLFTIWPHLSRALPTFFHRLAFPLIVTIFALDMWGNREPLPAMIRLDLMLLGYRCVAPRGRREDLQLILLSLFVVVVTGVYTVSPAFVLQILLFTGVALCLLLAVTLSDARGSGATAGAAPTWERVRWRELWSRLRAVADLRVVALGGALFVGVVGLSVVLFLALPRFEISNSFFLDRLITKKSRTGFSEDVRFQEVVDIAQDSGSAFAVDVSNPAMVPSEPYWRMLVLDEYSGEGFRMSAGLRDSFYANREKAHSHGGVGRGGDDDVRWTIYFQPGISRYLPLMGGFSRLNFGEPQALSQSSSLRIAALQNEPSKMIAYRVDGMDTDGILRDRRFAALGHVPPADPDRRRLRRRQNAEAPPPSSEDGGQEAYAASPTFLELPEFGPADRARLDAWVAEIGGAGDGGGDFARRAGAWLQARHTYSMQSTTPRGEGDVLIRWMASDSPGHCELFAGGLVILARAAGVPARLVTGFKGGVWNETSGHISVKNSDAHAWTEIWDAELASWLRSDATPGSRLTPSGSDADQHAGTQGLQRDEGWSARVDGLRIFWYRRIVNFDQGSQVELLRGTKATLRELMKVVREQIEQVLRDILAWLRQPWDFSRIAGISLMVGLTSGALALWRSAGRAWWMSWRSRRSATHGHDPVRREASRWLARLARVEGTREWVPGCAGVRAEVAASRAELLRLRFGAREGWAAPAAVFRRAKLAQRAAKKAPL